MISAVINVRNGMPELENALQSVRAWVDEIVVVDMGSSDGSKQVSESYGARVYDFEPVGYVEPARAFAVDQTHGDWIVVVDADEVVPRALSQRLRAVADEDRWDVVSVPEENWFFGGRIDHSGWEADVDRHFRFFRRGSLTLSPAIHSLPTPVGIAEVYYLPYEPGMAIAHFSYPTVSDFVERMNRYTSIEAEAHAMDRIPKIRGEGLRASVREVARRYVWHKGFRGRWKGSALAALMVMYRLLVVIKVQERAAGGPEAVRDAYGREVERLLAEYEPSE